MPVVEEFVKLVGYMAWPAVVFALMFLLRQELKSALKIINNRMSDPLTDISIGKEGLAIKRNVNALLGKMESLDFDQSQSKGLILQALYKNQSTEQMGVNSDNPSTEIDPELKTLADQYLQITAKDWRERVRLKNAAAAEMGNLVITKHVSKDLLATQTNEGLILALASAIHALPEKGDIDRLLKVADKVQRLHVKYKIVMALGRLFEQNLASLSDVGRVQKLLDFYKQDLDESLRQRIAQTEAIINLAIYKVP